MKIVIKTKSMDFAMPVPLSMAGFAIRAIPESFFADLRRKLPGPYDQLICRENLQFIFEECRDVIAEHKNLEMVHVETHDGIFISVVF